MEVDGIRLRGGNRGTPGSTGGETEATFFPSGDILPLLSKGSGQGLSRTPQFPGDPGNKQPRFLAEVESQCALDSTLSPKGSWGLFAELCSPLGLPLLLKPTQQHSYLDPLFLLLDFSRLPRGRELARQSRPVLLGVGWSPPVSTGQVGLISKAKLSAS